MPRAITDPLRDALGPLRRGRWTIGLAQLPIADVIRQGKLPDEIHWLDVEPPSAYYADPFPIELLADRLRVLAEAYDHRTGLGWIVELEVGMDGRLLGSRDVLKTDHHASYPFVLRRPEGLFHVPETYQAGRLSAFGLDHEAEHALMDVPAVDATLVEHGGRWWLFCTRHPEHGVLYLYMADDWRGPWRPHAANPVKRDLTSARPAGTLVQVDGQMYRPAQDCSRRYGGGIALNRVVAMDEERFVEETVARLGPLPTWPYREGLHTINGIGGWTVIDARRTEWRWSP